MLDSDGYYFVVTRQKTPREVDEFLDWMDENYISYKYGSNSSYWIWGASDATLVKLFWGA
jgi:hypothetical protein